MLRFFEIIILLLIVAFFCVWIRERYHKESFETNSVYKKANKYEDIYDDFYGFIYDDLFYQEDYYVAICSIFLKYINSVYNKKMCIGIKHGGHVNELLKNNMDTLSVSRSNSIINVCKYHYPNNKYKYIPNVDSNPYIFNENEFTHISIIDNELYYLANLPGFLYNCSRWLIFKGYLFIQCYESKKHLKSSFVKIGNNSSVRMKSVYTHEFKDFQNNDSFYFIETLKHRDNERKNRHTLFFYEKQYIESAAREFGLYLVESIPLNNKESVMVLQKR